jgi:hypothetical protein
MCTRGEDWAHHEIKHNCGARIVSTGESDSQRYACIILQLLGAALFYAFPARYLLNERNSAAVLVLGAILNAISLYSFLKASFTDPGIVPAADKPPYLVAEWRPPRTVNLIASRGKATLKYCDACNIYRPPRTEHCPTCQNCILRYDHRKCIFRSGDHMGLLTFSRNKTAPGSATASAKGTILISLPLCSASVYTAS